MPRTRRHPLLSLDLRGNSKDLFNKRIQFMQVRKSRTPLSSLPSPHPLSASIQAAAESIFPQLFALTESLAEDSIIEAIDLSNNFIDDLGAGSLASMLQV